MIQTPLAPVSQKVGFLAYYQPSDAKPSTHVPKEIAKLLVSRLAAEQISKRVIRAFPPDSVFLPVAPPDGGHTIPGTLPAAELPGVLFVSPDAQRDRARMHWHWEHSEGKLNPDPMAALERQVVAALA